MAKVAFNTLGCKVNQYETESMMAQFEGKGYETVAFTEKADVYIINTCTVTNMADKKSRQMLSKAKKKNPEALVVAVGCYVQASQSSLDEVEHVDLLVGNTDKGHIVEVVEKYLDDKILPEVTDLTRYGTYDDMWLSHESGHVRVHIKVQDGCDQFCSYCIIPFARGRIRSRESASVIEEVTSLTAKGYEEIVLTGIHLASYGVQFEQYRLIDLLEELDQLDGLKRIRLGSLEPTLITEEFVQRLSQLSKVCDHFHLSMQSGDDEILAAMNRNYTTEHYWHAVELLRDTYPDCGITTDLIVGFPGESDQHFKHTLGFIKKVAFSDVHVFKYSKRDGTKAAAMTNQVDGRIKSHRSKEALALVEDLRADFLDRYKSSVCKVLVEEDVVIDGSSYYVGHTTNFLKVYLEAKTGLGPKGIVQCTVEKRFRDGLLARL